MHEAVGSAARGSQRRRWWLIAGIGVLNVGMLGSAWAEPPIKSPQDAACRNEARARVFVTPDPAGIGLHAVGRQIYMACMARSEPRVVRKKRDRARKR